MANDTLESVYLRSYAEGVAKKEKFEMLCGLVSQKRLAKEHAASAINLSTDDFVRQMKQKGYVTV